MRFPVALLATALLTIPVVVSAEGNRVPAGKSMKEAGCTVRQAFTPPGKWLNAAPIIECPKNDELARKEKDTTALGKQPVGQD